MESYSSKLIDLLRREMASPQASRMQYENPAINATGESSGDINLRVNSSALNELSIEIKGDNT